MLPLHKTKLSVFNYDEIPPGYYYQMMLKGAPAQQFWHREKFNEVISRIGETETLLDFGCGPGAFLSLLGQNRPKVRAVGVDIGSRQIQFAQETVAAQHPDHRITFEILPPGPPALPFKNASFDVVTSIEVIEHIHPYLAYKVLEEAKRVLKPSGRLILTTPNYRSLWPLIEILLEKMSPVKYHDQHISKFTPNSLIKFVESAGFEIKSVKTIFVVAPFLASISRKLATGVNQLEKASRLRVGSILIVEAQPIQWT